MQLPMQPNQCKTGTLITVEGIDGSGKSTLVKGLVTRLTNENIPALTTQEPGGTFLGKALLEILRNEQYPRHTITEYLLFAADRAQHFHEVIVPALAQGILVISDRMADSSLAYQGYGRGVSASMITTINQWAMQEIKPTLVIYLQLSYQEAKARIIQRNEKLTAFEKRTPDVWQRTIDGFETIFKKRTNVLWLDATKPTQELVEQAYQALIEHHILQGLPHEH